jgi:zinc D-Ala-D-Ala carboxypeptidase
MKLSENFTLQELTASETAMKNGFTEQYSPSIEVIENLKLVAVNLLEPIRDKFGSFSPTVGYRCQRVNKKVGGATNSEHLRGCAIDETFFKDGKNICNVVSDWLIKDSGLKWSKLILEAPFKEGKVVNYRWLHIGYDRSNLHNQILIATPYIDKDGKQKMNYENY